MANNGHSYIFKCWGNTCPCRFVVWARSEQGARSKLWTTVKNGDYLGFPGCFAPTGEDLFTGKVDICYYDCHNVAQTTTKFAQFVFGVSLEIVYPGPVFFCSCLDG